MKKYLVSLSIVVLILLSLPAAYAAFPVKEYSLSKGTGICSTAAIDTSAHKGTSSRELVHIREKKKPVYLKSTAIYLALISIFFGGLGLHRFYLGYIAEGLFELLGIGCFVAGVAICGYALLGSFIGLLLLGLLLILLWFGSWLMQIVDLFAIIINQLPPKKGVFTKRKHNGKKEKLGWDKD